MLTIQCPSCGETLHVPKQLAGRQGRCKHCQGVVIVPSASGGIRRLRALYLGAALLTIAAGAAATAIAFRGSTGDRPPSLDDRIAAVLPTAEEDRFLEIPWRASLPKARAEAARTGKPIFLWMMNGNPLGGT